MVGQGSPSAWKVSRNQGVFPRVGPGTARLLLSGLVLLGCWFGSRDLATSAEQTVRLRFAWGSGNATRQRWTGQIVIEGGVLTQLQPLGIEPDAPVAQRIDGNRLLVDPIEKRVFDGCDVTLRADEQARVRVELRSEQTPQAAVFESTLSEIAVSQLQRPLDELGSYFLAHRSPGDQLRVLPTREHFVFEPGEVWSLELQPDLAAALQTGHVSLEVQLRGAGETKPRWETSQRLSETAQLNNPISFEITCPATEGAYRLTITARPEEGLATRFLPGQHAKPIATREVEFVVIDPAAKLPRLLDQWQPVLTIDPANPRWWQRLPAWARVPKLRERTSGAVGNVRPVVRPMATGDVVELPPTAEGEPYWQSYTLPVREPGEPHLVEMEVPRGVAQHLAISLIEPDAAGRVTTTQQDASLFSEARGTAFDGKVVVHRFVIWPRTTAPQLLVVNQHRSAPAQFGKITLLRQDAALAALSSELPLGTSERLVATYLSKPFLATSLGAAETLDVDSGLSVQSWSTFLTATQRLAQTLRLRGFNGVMLSVAADGSALYPSQIINPSPRYDTGLLAATGQDPTRKDVLEMVLRVFDREGLRVIPTVELAAPLPRLEILRLAGNSRETGIGCIGYNGQDWRTSHPTNSGASSFYNPLNKRVQAELAELLTELSTRYGDHVALSGVGVQLSGDGYGMLPGLAWGMDDTTVGEFSASTGILVAGSGDDRFRQRATVLLGEHQQAWRDWRTEQLTQFYTQLSQAVAAKRSDLQLYLATENVFSGPELQSRVRRAISESSPLGETLLDHGLNLARLDGVPAITVALPRRLGATDRLQQRAIDIRVNSATEQAELMPPAQHDTEMLYQTSGQFRLRSFDELSPFGTEQTYLSVTSQPRPAGAAGRQQLVSTLASHDATTIFAGGERLDSSIDRNTRAVMRTLQQLPASPLDLQTQRQQPVVLRVYRTKEATTLALLNESPWPARAEVSLASVRGGTWARLGALEEAADSPSLAGNLTENEQLWEAELQPHDLQAWRFDDPQLRVGELKTTVSDLARQELDFRIREIESRTGNLNIERPYAQLQNPGFELEDGGMRIVGWQPRQGAAGTIALDHEAPRSGQRALLLRSEDETGVAVQSHLFRSPETGQLLVSAYLKAESVDEDAQLRILVEDQDAGLRYRQFVQLDCQQLLGGAWSLYEFALGDVPLGDGEQLRLQFHLSGTADLRVDDVQLYDLHFDDARRRSLVKRIYTAKLALEKGQLIDCLSMLDDYWSQYMVHYVPSSEYVALQATKITPVAEPAEDQAEEGIGSRLRGWVPSFWR